MELKNGSYTTNQVKHLSLVEKFSAFYKDSGREPALMI